MTDSVLELIDPSHPAPARTPGWDTLRGTPRPTLLARLEKAFVAWQAGRLNTLSPERLWAPAMLDKRSFAEIRRARQRAQQD
ncbi:hypothetical protein [Bordetella petrii]|uniref:hypothetical protein n=1 Tax=Bordetella petrii TaxID=94624 RepID=UPI001E3520C8|nr:hypothetical protein [Bordetella petrii]MCD0503335.1 hypothetical protein [Bordetella petrii]